MFNLYVTHPFGTFGKPVPESQFADLESAIDGAFNRIAEIVPNCRVWIETENGQILPLMN
jgi:hypothetical protein